jgi:phospholipid/cholesterol/gamma-HCH transport system ATP-binding protein
VIATGTMEQMLACDHPWLRAYFHGVRGSRLTGALRRSDGSSERDGGDETKKDETWKPAPITP